MHYCSFMSRNWKMGIKTCFGVMSLILLLLGLSTPIEAATERQRAVVRASDGDVYEIQYAEDLRIENFSIHGLDGAIPSREIASELYIAAWILNQLSTASDIFTDDFVFLEDILFYAI